MADIENCPKIAQFALIFQATQPKDKILSHNIPERPCISVRTDIFSINTKHYLCIIDSCSTFSVIKQVEGFGADNLIKM